MNTLADLPVTANYFLCGSSIWKHCGGLKCRRVLIFRKGKWIPSKMIADRQPASQAIPVEIAIVRPGKVMQPGDKLGNFILPD